MLSENPFQDPLRFERQTPECVIVIFGANGDLTKRKLLPALYRLAFDRRLAAGFAIVGISRTPLSDDAFRQKMRASVEQFSEDTKLDDDVWAAFARGLYYVSGDIGDAGLYQRLGEKLGQIESQRHTGGTPRSGGVRMVAGARLHSDEDRDPEHQRARLPVLSTHGSPVGGDPPVRICGCPGCGA